MPIISHGHTNASNSSASDPRIADTRAALLRFELGRFLLSNLGLNGYWTSYVLMHPERGGLTNHSSDGAGMTELESWLLNRCPIILATQERFQLFRALTQPLIRSGMRLASVPSGLMDDLLTLDYSETEGVVLTAVDLDPTSLSGAETNYRYCNPPVRAQFEARDAWNLESADRWDLVTSNGLNIYVEDDERCTDFYRSVSGALRPQGVFIVSFITPPDQWQPRSASDLDYQRFLFQEVLPVKWTCVRDEGKTRQQLTQAGFEVMSVTYDEQRMFPAVVAKKGK